MDKSSNSYSIHNKANAFTRNVVHQLNHDIAKRVCIAFHLQPASEGMERIDTWGNEIEH